MDIYQFAVNARDLAISLKKRRREFSDNEVKEILHNLIKAKKEIYYDAIWFNSLLYPMDLENLKKNESIIHKMVNHQIPYEDAKNYEYVIITDYNVLFKVKKNEIEILNFSEIELKKQLDILIDTIKLLNKCISIFQFEEEKRKG